MNHRYVSFVSDEHLLQCIANLHQAYQRARQNTSKQTFYKNKVDTIKLTFDARFNGVGEEDLIEAEILRQIDKSTNNSIGTFHEQVLGGIEGFESGRLQGYDIRALDDTLFADIKNKHNTMNSSSAESLFQKLKHYADQHKQAKCYWVQIWAKGSFCELWRSDINGKEYSHSRVYKISGDRFYALLSGQEDALYQLYRALPRAIDDYLSTLPENEKQLENSALAEICAAKPSSRSLLDQISLENYPYYAGFDTPE